MAAAAAAAQWCGAAGLDRWVGRWRCTLSPAALPVPSRRTRRKGGVVGCVSVPREVAAAAAVEPAAPPEAEAETEVSYLACSLSSPALCRSSVWCNRAILTPTGRAHGSARQQWCPVVVLSRKSNRLPFVTVLTLTSLRRPIYHRRFRSLGSRLDPGQRSP